MADEMFDEQDDVVGAEEPQPGEKRVGFLPGAGCEENEYHKKGKKAFHDNDLSIL